ncbi:AAA family ATPase [Photobacterium sp. OFAV2-7]|uniref:AAA family ATPase n=1 Tax=Photobacterium sp. OFAV2-7 TaxID=2917748 RepID=UPI001EF62A8A|nr:AAA family ATPase [Photobacterium sp. OFAV2-7]
MEKWRINRLKINGFKVFSEFEESFSNSLVVYDGPNGFGKTSLFDAKQILFCNKLPRVDARFGVLKVPGNKKFSKSLYQNHNSDGDVSIIAEFRKGNESLYIMRMARAADLRRGSNKPNSFDDFKLYELASFSNTADARLIEDESLFWSEKLGDKFLSNFSVLNYLQQDSKSIVLPDKCDERSRTGQIEHLINLDRLKRRIEDISKLKSVSKKQWSAAESEFKEAEQDLKGLEDSLLSEDVKEVSYTKVTEFNTPPNWDMEHPFSTQNFKQVDELLENVNLLKRTYLGKEEIAKRIINKQKVDFTKREEFGLAVRLYHQFERVSDLTKQKARLSELEKLCNTLNNEPAKLSSAHREILNNYLEEEVSTELGKLLKSKNKLLLEQGGLSSKQADTLQVRDKLLGLSDENDSECPLCGFDYTERVLLIEAIDVKTERLKQLLDGVSKKIAMCYQSIAAILNPLKNQYVPIFEKLKSEFEVDLYNELTVHEHQGARIKNIGERLISLGIELPKKYAVERVSQVEQIEQVKNALLKSLEPEDDIITNQEVNFFSENFGKFSKLEKLTEEIIESKKHYIQKQYNLAVNASIAKKRKDLVSSGKRVTHLNTMNKQLGSIETKLKHAQTDYMHRTIGQMESLFHIYSGRLLQNYQSGLGVFIDMPVGQRKNAVMNFTTARDSQHDATLSMSSGQISALSLSLFLALNKKYAKTAFVFIDDPTQCMDEINIASLSDLLRVELRDRQVIISTHEQDISDYLCYRYGKAGLDRQQVNLLEKSKQAALG